MSDKFQKDLDQLADQFGKDLDQYTKNNWFGLGSKIISEIKASEQEISKWPDRDSKSNSWGG